MIVNFPEPNVQAMHAEAIYLMAVVKYIAVAH